VDPWWCGSAEASSGHPRVASDLLPLISANPGLTKQSREQCDPDVAAVRVRDAHGHIVPDHELVLAARVRPVETKLSEGSDEISPAYTSERRHSSHLSYLKLDSVHGRQRQASGDSKQDPLFENLFELLTALL
jgi:hypothetical protein